MKINFVVEKSLCKKSELIKSHLEKLCRYKGEQKGIKEARKRILCYLKDIFEAAKTRHLKQEVVMNIFRYLGNEI